MKYTTTFKKAVLRKVLPPENRSVHSVSKGMGVGEITIHRWISQIKDGTLNLEQDEEETLSKEDFLKLSPEECDRVFDIEDISALGKITLVTVSRSKPDKKGTITLMSISK